MKQSEQMRCEAAQIIEVHHTLVRLFGKLDHFRNVILLLYSVRNVCKICFILPCMWKTQNKDLELQGCMKYMQIWSRKDM